MTPSMLVPYSTVETLTAGETVHVVVKRTECPYCYNGVLPVSGRGSDGHERCPDCDGRGWVPARVPTPQPCPNCLGTGHKTANQYVNSVNGNPRCDTCLGLGTVNRLALGSEQWRWLAPWGWMEWSPRRPSMNEANCEWERRTAVLGWTTVESALPVYEMDALPHEAGLPAEWMWHITIGSCGIELWRGGSNLLDKPSASDYENVTDEPWALSLQAGDVVLTLHGWTELDEPITAAPCPTCNSDCFVDAISESKTFHPDATGINGEPYELCPTCVDGFVPLVLVSNRLTDIETQP